MTSSELFSIGFYLLLTGSLIAKSIVWLFFSDGFVTRAAVLEIVVWNVCWVVILSIWLAFVIARNLIRMTMANIQVGLALTVGTLAVTEFALAPTTAVC